MVVLARAGLSPQPERLTSSSSLNLRAGEAYGYKYDRWEAGVFHFTGDGQVGDQELRWGNRAIINHRKDGRALRVFRGARGVVTYVGEFDLAADPYYYAEATDRLGHNRRVIVFKLVPVGAVADEY